jgi:hypothetical protein
MRRTLLALALLLGVFVGFVPGDAKADHCNRISALTRNKVNPLLVNPGAVGCTHAAAHANTRRMMPASDEVWVRVSKTEGQTLPVAGTITTDTKTEDLMLKPNTGDEESATFFEHQMIPIGSTSKFEIKITFADGTDPLTGGR